MCSITSVTNTKGAFWFKANLGGAEFVQLLKSKMAERENSVHLVIDGVSAHKKVIVKEYVSAMQAG